jgi:ATP-dependent RNA helicase SrmB
VLAKRAEKKEEKEKPRVKKRHRDTKNIGKRRKPSAAGTPSASTKKNAGISRRFHIWR